LGLICPLRLTEPLCSIYIRATFLVLPLYQLSKQRGDMEMHSHAFEPMRQAILRHSTAARTVAGTSGSQRTTAFVCLFVKENKK
jgi:hypothetical protein